MEESMTIYVTYDTRSGKIISVHHGATDVNQARQRAHDRRKIDQQHIDVISVEPDRLQNGKQYKVDQGRKVLVEAAPGEGLGFGFGVTARLRAR
jgi:hypothetical protein